MEDPSLPKERRKYPRVLINLPLNFRMTENPNLYPGLSINASEAGLLIHTLKNMPIGIRLNIEVLFAKDFQLSNLQGIVEIIWKDNYFWKDCRGYKYGLKFTQISNEDYMKLKVLLSNQYNLEEISLKRFASP